MKKDCLRYKKERSNEKEKARKAFLMPNFAKTRQTTLERKTNKEKHTTDAKSKTPASLKGERKNEPNARKAQTNIEQPTPTANAKRDNGKTQTAKQKREPTRANRTTQLNRTENEENVPKTRPKRKKTRDRKHEIVNRDLGSVIYLVLYLQKMPNRTPRAKRARRNEKRDDRKKKKDRKTY
jgi:hypothetical protein